MKKIESIILNTKVFVLSCWVAIIASLCLGILELITSVEDTLYLFLGLAFLFKALLDIGLFYAFKNGHSSFQKTAIAAILSLITTLQLLLLSATIAMDIYSLLYEVVMTIVTVVIFFNHLYFQNDHKGEENYIVVNVIMVIIALLLRIYELIYNIMSKGTIYDYLWSIESVSCLIMILGIEARIQHYKIERFKHIQVGTWTEEEKIKQKSIFKI